MNRLAIVEVDGRSIEDYVKSHRWYARSKGVCKGSKVFVEWYYCTSNANIIDRLNGTIVKYCASRREINQLWGQPSVESVCGSSKQSDRVDKRGTTVKRMF